MVEWFEKHKGRYPSDFATEKRIDASIARDLAAELVAEGILEPDLVEKDKEK